MKKVLNIFAGMALGAAVGVGLALVLAPESGDELQRRIKEWWAQVQAAGQEAAEQRRLELTAQLREMRQPEA
ncbi:MAG: YtxH domain-containing protein [Anaerolineae bacterium]